MATDAGVQRGHRWVDAIMATIYAATATAAAIPAAAANYKYCTLSLLTVRLRPRPRDSGQKEGSVSLDISSSAPFRNDASPVDQGSQVESKNCCLS